jgi:hypothetical protein
MRPTGTFCKTDPNYCQVRVTSQIPKKSISWNICRGMATSAIWKTTQRPWLITFAPILISFSFKLVSDQSLTGSAADRGTTAAATHRRQHEDVRL